MGSFSYKTVNIKETFAELCRQEKKLGFFSFCHKGIPLWMYPRELAGYMINGGIREGEQGRSAQDVNIAGFFKRALFFITNLKNLVGNDAIVFTNERHLQPGKNGKFYNPYAELILSKSNGLDVLVFEFPNRMTGGYMETKYKKYLPMDLFLALSQIFFPLSYLYAFKVKKLYSEKLAKSGLWNDRQIKEILKICRKSLYRISVYRAILGLLKLINPKLRFVYSCMAGYDKFPEVIEIQHGVIHDFHHHYFFPAVVELNGYLNLKKMIVFSKELKNLFVENGYSSDNIFVEENPKIKYYFINNFPDGKFDYLKQNKILIISDWGGNCPAIFNRLVLDIEENRGFFEGWDVDMILHPTEKNTYKDKNLSEVRVLENHKTILWDLLKEATCVISINSTVLQEAVSFGCFNIVLIDKKSKDQRDYIRWLCQDYEHKDFVNPEDFVGWFRANAEKLENHKLIKEKVLAKNIDVRAIK